MAVQHGLHVLAAAAVAALAGRWWSTRARRDNGHGAGAARAPWRRTTPSEAGTGHERVVSLHAAFLDRTDHQELRTADAHLDRYWANIAPLYPRTDTGRTQS
ncbi:hypothetical protein [Streptomyces virginiae]|uniref:hypothetical protein n=1 Tax=Streptomyces virginiae TaxID=1961 RepID=UPI002DDA0759|nr:hypothetical protein [Streptomyces virginiae]WSC81993.1 hypothetical protein OHA56_39845 [Streptomyces virginiae]